MKLLISSISTSGFVLLGILLSKQPFRFFIPAIAMNHQSTPTCNVNSVQASLRIWLDRIPDSPSGALPPGVVPPAPQPRGSETHALNLELTLVNTNQQPQTARVLGWSWSQGDRTHPVAWSIQPDMSPLNRYNQIQRQLVELHGNQTVTAIMELEINGRSCQLQVQTQP